VPTLLTTAIKSRSWGLVEFEFDILQVHINDDPGDRTKWRHCHLIAVVKRVGTAPSHNCQKKKSVKCEFLLLRVVAQKMNDTNMMYKNLAIDCMYFWVKYISWIFWLSSGERGRVLCSRNSSISLLKPSFFLDRGPPSSFCLAWSWCVLDVETYPNGAMGDHHSALRPIWPVPCHGIHQNQYADGLSHDQRASNLWCCLNTS